MPGFAPRQLLSIVSSRMMLLGALYPLRRAARVVRATRPGLRGIRYAWAVLRQLRTPAEPARPPIESFSFLGAVRAVRGEGPGAVVLDCAGGALRILALDEDVFQLRYRPDAVFEPPFSYSVAKGADAWEPVDVEVRETGERVEIATALLRLVVDKATGELSLLSEGGQPLLRGGRGAAHSPSGQVVWQATFPEETPFYGMGEKAFGLNLAGRELRLWNTDPAGYGRGRDPIYMSVPFALALVEGQAVGIYVDNTYRGWADFGTATPGAFTYRAAGGELRLCITAGAPARVLEQYTALTGRLRLPPLWAFGLHQSRWSYYPQGRVLAIAGEFRRRELPCDVIHIDIHYMDGYRSFTWDRERFPALEEMTGVMREQGFKALTMIDPGIKVDPGYRVYDEGVARDAFVKYPDGVRFTAPVWPGDCHFPDFSDPAVREWWGGLYRDLLDGGVEAFWNDMNEPAVITAGAGAGEVPGILVHSKDGRGATHGEIHNVYGLLMVRATVEGLEALRPGRRPLVLSRSGWAGLQRYAIHWTGDNQSTWDHLALTIPMALNLGMSGIAITGPDTGGFTGGPSPELFARWMQLGAFTPFFRIHSMVGSVDQEPWAFGPDVEAISRLYLELRYRLLPYIYSAAWQASQTGLPIMRALAFLYPEDEQTHSMDDEYLFGDAFLVAPVLVEGGRRRQVYLPEGQWLDFWTGERHEGQQTITVDAPLDVLPLFVRGGSVVPFWPVQQYVGEKPIDELELRVYGAPGEHSSWLYEDDGERPDYEQPEHHQVSWFVLAGDEQGMRLTREIFDGTFTPGYETIRLHVVGLESEPASVSLAGGDLLEQTWDASTRSLTLRLRAAKDFALEMA